MAFQQGDMEMRGSAMARSEEGFGDSRKVAGPKGELKLKKKGTSSQNTTAGVCHRAVHDLIINHDYDLICHRNNYSNHDY